VAAAPSLDATRGAVTPGLRFRMGVRDAVDVSTSPCVSSVSRLAVSAAALRRSAAGVAAVPPRRSMVPRGRCPSKSSSCQTAGESSKRLRGSPLPRTCGRRCGGCSSKDDGGASFGCEAPYARDADTDGDGDSDRCVRSAGTARG
jgi:hypothetical protein